MCNASLPAGVLPTSQKHALVRPLLKKSTLDPYDLCSYRPISNLTFVSKMVERVVAVRLLKHVDSYNLLPERQSAYRRFHSTETAIAVVHNDLVRAADADHVTALVLLDLSSAFDTVDHHILLSVLQQRFGVDGLVMDWFRSYLSDRQQTLVFGGKNSVTSQVNCSVPQGSVLGPLEFIAYTEDVIRIFERHNINHHLYADDKQIYADAPLSGINDVRNRLHVCTDDVRCWCASRRLQLNDGKTELAWFGKRSRLRRLADLDCTVTVGTSVIQPKDVVRDLGVMLDSELSMKQHIAKVTSTCFYQLRRLRQVRRLVGQEITAQLVHAFVLSRVYYGNSVLAGLPKSTIAPLQRTTSTERRCSTRARPKNARSRDTGTTATPLASCAPARRLQTVYIDARRTHRTVSDVPCRYSPRRRRQSNTNRAAFGGYCIVSETQMLQRTRRTGFLIRWPTRLERSSTCTSWYSRPETVQKSTKNIYFGKHFS